MLSFNKSDRAIAMVKGGEHKGKIVYYHDKKDPNLRIPAPLERYADHSKFCRGRNILSEKEIDKILQYINTDNLPDDVTDDELLRIFADTRESAISRNFMELKLNEGEFVILPYEKPNQVEIIYLTGPKGSGKSTSCRRYADTYKVYFPENRVFLISRKEEDPILDDAGFITRIAVDDTFLEGEPLGPKDFTDSLVIFDDIESISNKKLKEAVYQLKNDLMMTGRSENVYVMSVAHVGCNGHDTKIDLTEADAFITYDNNTPHHLERLLTVYGGLDKHQFKRVRDLKSRWVFTHKSRPRYIIGEKDVILL
jgi:hypothetical protein